jgi:hypothetical protein
LAMDFLKASSSKKVAENSKLRFHLLIGSTNLFMEV